MQQVAKEIQIKNNRLAHASPHAPAQKDAAAEIPEGIWAAIPGGWYPDV